LQQRLVKTVHDSYLPKELRIRPLNEMQAVSGDFLPAEGELCTPEGRRFIYIFR
jgi:hypothetical protein